MNTFERIQAAPVARPLTVLVADDDRDLREVLAEVLASEGWLAIQATDGLDAVEKTLALHPDALLLDEGMPQMTGSAAARELRRRGATQPMILVSATRDLHPLARELAVDGFLPKPFGVDDVLGARRRALDVRRSSPPSVV
jgi:two-component system KDP operon response regulator KdpE